MCCATGEIKFKAFLDFAMKLGADRLATGHFCQLGDAPDGKKQLLRGADGNKDQSYFLYMLGQNALEKAMFPVGHLTKAQVREIAADAGLANCAKKDSTGVCFIGERHFKPFLQQFLAGTARRYAHAGGKGRRQARRLDVLYTRSAARAGHRAARATANAGLSSLRTWSIMS